MRYLLCKTVLVLAGVAIAGSAWSRELLELRSSRISNAPAAGTTSTGITYTVVASPEGLAYTAISDNNPSAAGLDVVIVGDGYDQSSEDQARLTNAAHEFVNRLLQVPPYSEAGSCINFWLINLVSKESGIDDPVVTPAHLADTALNCTFAGPGSMQIKGTDALVQDLCSLAGVPFDVIFVIVHDKFDHDGAMANYETGIAYASDMFTWGTVVAHELGHVIGRLADEYRAPSCFLSSSCIKRDPTASYNESWAPEEPNVTNAEALELVPWAGLLETKSFPTTIDSVLNGDVIGRWEGGDERCFGVYRPRQSCLMDGVTGENPADDPFCPVCSRAIVDSLRVRFGCP